MEKDFMTLMEEGQDVERVTAISKSLPCNEMCQSSVCDKTLLVKVAEEIEETLSDVFGCGMVSHVMSYSCDELRRMRCPKPNRTNPSCCLKRRWNPEGSCGTETPLTCLLMNSCQRLPSIWPISLGATRRTSESPIQKGASCRCVLKECPAGVSWCTSCRYFLKVFPASASCRWVLQCLASESRSVSCKSVLQVRPASA